MVQCEETQTWWNSIWLMHVSISHLISIRVMCPLTAPLKPTEIILYSQLQMCSSPILISGSASLSWGEHSLRAHQKAGEKSNLWYQLWDILERVIILLSFQMISSGHRHPPLPWYLRGWGKKNGGRNYRSLELHKPSFFNLCKISWMP